MKRGSNRGALLQAVRELSWNTKLLKAKAAIYGPKLDFLVTGAARASLTIWARCTTIGLFTGAEITRYIGGGIVRLVINCAFWFFDASAAF